MIGLFFPHSARTLREPPRRAAHETSAATAPSDGSAMTSSSRPQFFLHFPGSGGTSIHAFAQALYGRNATRCHTR